MTDEKTSNLSQKLKSTRERLNNLSKKVSQSTKKIVKNTNESIKTTISEHKEKRETKKQEKISKARDEISKNGLMDDVPEMVTLPVFEQERMEIVEQQHDAMISIVEEMQRLSERLDHVEKRYRTVTNNDVRIAENNEKDGKNTNFTSPVMSEVIHLLGASLIWIVILFGIDKFLSQRELLIMGSYPAEIPAWALGACTWSLYMLHRLGESSQALKLPKLLLFQTSAAVGITTAIGLMVYDDTMTTISNVWTWGTIIAIALLLASSMIASALNSTKKFVGMKNE